ncbi:MAG: Rieske 2Fe-2S domain-containing protein [Anaerolineae bacterium]
MVDKPERLSVEEYEAVARRLDELIRQFEALPFPQVQAQVFELLDAIDTLHRAGLTRLVEFLQASGQGKLLDQAAQDPIIENLFILYDLVQADEPSQPLNALPLVSSGSFVSIEEVDIRPRRDARRPVFQDVARLADVPPGTMRHYDVDGVPVLLANVAGEVYAVRDQCPTGVVPLSLGSFSAPIVVCPWHNEAWDIRTGRRVDGSPEPRLDVLPIAINGDAIRLAVNTTSSSGPASVS